jgi:hypothetical protein
VSDFLEFPDWIQDDLASSTPTLSDVWKKLDNIQQQLADIQQQQQRLQKKLSTMSNKLDFVYGATCMSRVADLILPFGYSLASTVANVTVNGFEFNLCAKLTLQNSTKRIPISPLKSKQLTNRGRFPSTEFGVPTTILIGECTTGDDYDAKFNQLTDRVLCVRNYYRLDVDILIVFFGQKLKGFDDSRLTTFVENHLGVRPTLTQLYEAGKFFAFY